LTSERPAYVVDTGHLAMVSDLFAAVVLLAGLIALLVTSNQY
jgi:hypothetical protein